jgi:tryptophanyl-tRNA synthetase
MRNFEASIPVGFFTYPISQASDITAFKATTVRFLKKYKGSNP